MFRRFTLLSCLCAAALVSSGCPTNDEPTTFTLYAMTGGGACVADLAPGNQSVALQKSAYAIRVTFLERPKGDTPGPLTKRRYELACYRVVETKETVDFVVPANAKTRYTVRVEAFGADGRLAFVGHAHDQDLTGGQVAVYLHPTGPKKKTCSYTTRRPRAFHSATVLPNGEVLLLGGLVTKGGAPDGLSAIAYGSASVDRYAPATFDRSIVTDNLPQLARAFHQAVLLPSPAAGPYDILIVGGLMPAEGAKELRVARMVGESDFPCPAGTCSHFFNFIPYDDGRPGETGVVTYTPASGSTPASATYQALPSAGIDGGFFPQLTLLDDTHALLVGGARAYRLAPQPGLGDPGQATWLELKPMSAGGPTATTSSLGRLRAGHAVAATVQGFIVVGGKLDGTYQELAADFAERTATSGGGFSPLAGPPGLESTAWHTLTPLGLTDEQLFAGTVANEVLLAGGFTGITDGQGDRPYRPVINGKGNPEPFYRMAVSSSATALQQVGAGAVGAFPDVGYHRALRLGDGSVLLSGGNTNKCRPTCGKDSDCPGSTCAADGRCVAEQPSVLCASDAVIVLRAGSDTPHWGRGDIAQLSQPRYGHAAVRLLDDSVLILGGLQLTASSTGGVPRLLVEGERYQLTDGTLQDVPFWVERDGKRLGSGQLSDNSIKGGACLTRAEVGQVVSSLAPLDRYGSTKTVTAPLPRTNTGRRSRAVRVVFAPAP